MLGMPLDAAEIVRLLQALELTVVADGEGQWSVGVPSHRFDISLEVDLIEELARLYGYNRLPVRYPQARLAPNNKPEARAALPLLRRLLVARGYQEAITFSFIDPALFELFDPGTQPLTLANPISADMAAMRSSLWPGLVKALQHNLNRQQSRVRLFESGLRFVGQLEGLKQEAMLAGAICGKRLPEGWANGRDGVDFFDAKADVEAVLASAGALGDFSFVPGEHPALHRGRPRASSGKGGWSATWVRCIRNWRRNSTSSSRCSSSSCCWPKWSTVTCRSSASCRASRSAPRPGATGGSGRAGTRHPDTNPCGGRRMADGPQAV